MASRLLRTAAGGALALLLGGCATGRAFPARPAPEALPAGSPLRSTSLGETDAWLRYYLMQAAYDSALQVLDARSRTHPRDELVRRLQLGVVLHEAGRYDASNAAFEWAEREADERYTRSASRAVGSALVNDKVLRYVPARPELAMIPYYRMLNYLALGRVDEAAVEARKASGMLARGEGKPEECSGGAFLQYLTGLVYRTAGERNDALVSFRQSERAFDACAAKEEVAAPSLLGADLLRTAAEVGVGEVADSAAARYHLPRQARPGDTGDLVVVLEHGWVAHRAPRELHVPLFPEDVDGVRGDDHNGIADAAAQVSARLLNNLAEQSAWGAAMDDRPVAQWADALDGAYIFKLSWPVYRLEASRPAQVRVLVDDSVAASTTVEDLSSRVADAFEAQRPLVLTRAVGRGVTKYVLTREVERKAKKQGGEVAAFFASRLANLAGNVLEQADTRSWSLLPDRISLARVALPAGEHRVRIEVRGGEGVDTLDLGTVEIRAGSSVFRSRRVWGSEQGDATRFPTWDDRRLYLAYGPERRAQYARDRIPSGRVEAGGRALGSHGAIPAAAPPRATDTGTDTDRERPKEERSARAEGDRPEAVRTTPKPAVAKQSGTVTVSRTRPQP